MRDSDYTTALSKCVRCGSCKALCPAYEEETTEAMSARGKLTLLWGLSSGLLSPSPELCDRVFGCLLCGRCVGSCPLEIDIKELMYHGRRSLRDMDKGRRILRFLTKLCIKRPGSAFKMLSRMQHILFPYFLKKGILPFRPELPENHLKDRFRLFTVLKKQGRVAVFSGCMINFLYPYLGEALVNTLRRLNYEVILPPGEVCCGVPLRAVGLEEEAVKLAKKNINTFKRLNVEAVLSLCPTCTYAIKVEYPKLIGEGIERAEDISTFLIDKIESIYPQRSSFTQNIIFHDPCHLKYGLGIEREPRVILKNLGLNPVKINDDRCCGFAGLFCFSFKETSRGLLNRCVEDYTKAGGEIIITSCPGCMMQLSREIKDKPVIHLIEAVEEAMLQPVSLKEGLFAESPIQTTPPV
ncbi:MAG: (Fe-S)-binding protein [Nitrospirota bacterium]